MSFRELPRSLVAHFGWLHTLSAVLGDRLRRRAIRITALSLLEAALELLSIGSVVPLLSLVAKPDSSVAQKTVSYLTPLLGPLQREEAIVVVGSAMATVVTAAVAVKLLALVARSRFMCEVRVHIANRLLKNYAVESYERQLRASPGRRLTLVIGESSLVASLTNGLVAVVGSSVTVGAMVAIMFALDWRITLVAAALGGLISGVAYIDLSRRLRTLGELAKAERFTMMTLAARLLQGFSETAIYDRDRKVEAEFEKHSLVFADLTRWLRILRRLPVILVEWLLAIGVVVGICIVATFAEFAAVLPVAVAFAAAVLRLGPAAVTAVSSAAQLRFNLSSLYEINKELKTLTVARTAARQTGAPVAFREGLSFENVSFRYQSADMPAVSGINVTVRHGTILALCGPSGSGKSTFVNLLLGLLTPTEGDLRVDGMSIRGREGDWQRLIAHVPQDPFFWNASLKENLLFGRSYNDAESRIQYALETVQLAKFVNSLPKGVETTIGERGALISGGQRQRLAIARALVGDPELLVLDEPTSALDHEIARAIDDALVDLKGKKTVVIAAHRPTSIARCDHVLYVERGSITGEGSFDFLARTHKGFMRTFGFAQDIQPSAEPSATSLAHAGARS